MSIATYLTALDRDRDALAANLTTKGVPASSSETFTTLVPKVLNIPSGGGGGDIEWTDTLLPVSTTAPTGTNASNLINVGLGIKKLTVENLKITGTVGFLGFGNMEELTFKNCTFGNGSTGYSIEDNGNGGLPKLTKLTIKDCTFEGGSSGYGPLRISYASVNSALDVTIDGLTIPTGTTITAGNTTSNFFVGQGIKSITFRNIELNGYGVFSYLFNSCSSLTSIDLSSFVVAPTKVQRMFQGCTSLTTLDISGLDCTGITSSTNYTNMFNNVPTTCAIYVKDAANQAWFSSKFSNYTFTIKT